MSRALLTLTYLHSAYFALTGLWPLLHIRSFLAVTGPKNDLWLVKTVGVLVTAIAATLTVAAWRRNVTTEIAVLAALSAAALAAIDIVYVAKRTISKIYL